MLHIRSDDISEKQLAEIALAIQNRWGAPTFVKMHEIVVVDEDLEVRSQVDLIRDFESGIRTIFQNLDMSSAFRYEKIGKNKMAIIRIPGSRLPSWMEDIQRPVKAPEGVFACPHCGKQFRTDLEMSLHTKLHYLPF
jgi:hypothetical protein